MNIKKEDLTRTCNKCNVQYPNTLEFFYKNRTGLRPTCKTCYIQQGATLAKPYRLKNKEKIAKRQKQWRDKNPGYWAEKSKNWRRENPEKWRNLQLKRANFTLELFDQMLEAQRNLCALCGTDKPRGRGRFHADHDHKTGKPRGVLCMNCNHTIGNIENNPSDWIDKAKDYIKQGGFYQPVDKP